jgi:hypothetical protein
MKNSWTSTFRRLAAGAIVVGATAFSSAMCYAQSAYDDASDGAYADGWQAGDNGGFGFTPWNWDGGYIYAGTNYTYNSPLYAQVDDGLQNGTQFSNPHNAIGRSWAIGASMQPNEGAIHIGRGFAPLNIGQTLTVVFDNPNFSPFFKGYFVRLNGDSGGTNGNICNLGYGCSHPNFPDGYPVGMNNLSRFEYFNYGQWNLYDAGSTGIGVVDDDTSAAGAVYKVRRIGPNHYRTSLDSLGGGADYSSGTRVFETNGAEVDWIEFVFFNANGQTGVGFSDLTPTLAEPQTDLYIRSMRISVPEPASFGLLVLGAGTLFGIGTARRRKD